MSTIPTRMTSQELAVMSDEGKRYELIEGELKVMAAAGGRHGQVAMRIGQLSANHVEEWKLGEVFAAETGFLLATDPDTVRAPDAAFVRTAAIQQLDDLDGYLPLAPDLVIEVISPSDASTEVETKAQMWLKFGTNLVLVVDPASKSIRAYRTPSQIEVHFVGDTLDASDVVDGWKIAVGDVF